MKKYRPSLLKYAFEGNLTRQWRTTHGSPLDSPLQILERILKLKEGIQKKKTKHFIVYQKENLPGTPSEWIWTTMGVIAKTMKNGIYRPPKFYADEGVACLRMYNIQNGSIIFKDIKRMKLTQEEISEYKLLPDDILVNRVNSRELVGKAATIPPNLETCVYESKNIRVRVFNQFIVSKLVSFWFQFYAQTYFNTNAQQTVGMASINQEQLSAMPIPLMSFQEQKFLTEEIEERFLRISQIMRNVELSLEQVHQLQRSILKNAFEGKLVPQDPNDEPAP